MNYATADLRTFLQDAQSADLLLTIDKPVDVEKEVAALCSETVKPTVFTNLKGHEGFQLTDCLTRFRNTQALALGIPRGDPSLVLSSYLEKLAQGPGPTVTIDDAPNKEVIWTGTDVDLRHLPVPVPSEGLDFPHMRHGPLVHLKAEHFQVPTISGGLGVSKHPDGTLNTFFTMAKVVGRNKIQFFMFPGGHTERNVLAWAELGKRCPFALVIGCHPIYELGAVYTGPHAGFSELNLVSSLLGDAVPMVKCESIDLEVPALSEIVIEGEIHGERKPYFHGSAHTDTYTPIVSLEPSFHVSAITMRKNPIYRHIQPNRFTEHHSFGDFMVMAPMLQTLRAKQLPVKDVHLPLHSCGNCAVIQMTPNNKMEVREAMLTAMANPIAPRLAIIVDDDINIYDFNDVLYALSIRTHGTDDVEGFNGVRALAEPLTILIKGPKDIEMRPNNRWAIDATKPALDEPEHRLEWSRLRARGEGKVKLADFI